MERVLGCRPDENNRPLLNSRQERILTGAVEAVHLVQKQDCLRAVQRFGVLCALNDFPDILNARFHCVQADEFAFRLVGDNVGKRRLAAAGRPVQQNGRDLVRFNSPAKKLSFAYDMLLSDIFIKSFRPHAVGQETPVTRLLLE
ncbi:hypothetical protein D3C81_597770 [compost metagenome]